MTRQAPSGAHEAAPSAPAFTPVQLRYRRDGLTPERQVALIQAMAACGCIREACRRVGISAESVYQLLKRPDAQSFRIALDLALDGAADRVEHGLFGRAIDGVEIPHYYKGELVGTHRRYDERLAMFILRYRKPHRYGRHLDRRETTPHPERAALGLADALAWVENDARRDEAGLRRTVSVGPVAEEDESWDLTQVYRWGPAAGAPADEPADEDDPFDPDDEDADDPLAPDHADERLAPDVASGSSTSARARNRRARRAAAARTRKR